MNSKLLQTPIAYLKGVGPKRAETLASELGIRVYQDLLHLFPHRYIDKTRYYKIGELQATNAEVQIMGKVVHLKTVAQKKGSRLVARFQDQTGEMELVWFRGQKWMRENLKLNVPYVIFGKCNRFNNSFSMPHPEMELLAEHEEGIKIQMQPVYPSTEKLSNKGISNRVMGKFLQQLFLETKGQFTETLPEYLLHQLKLIPRAEALHNIHFPKSQGLLAKAQFRLKFEELFFLQMQLIAKNMLHKQKIKGHPFHLVGDRFKDFYDRHLPFELTGAQKRVLREIRADMGSRAQMNRLLQGDVGSGKTIVAVMAMLLALDNGFQACLMAPTEILATQHHQGISELLRNTEVRCALLTGSVKKAARRPIHQELEDGTLHILIGTHALLEDKVQFQNLGLAIIDEQHRFGVAQRSKLWKKGGPSPTPPAKEVDRIHNKYKTAKPKAYAHLKEVGSDSKKQAMEAQDLLWEKLRGAPWGNCFRRLVNIDVFTVDFACLSKKLIVEVANGLGENPEERETEALRRAMLAEFGYKVLQFTGDAITNAIDTVIQTIAETLGSLPVQDLGRALPPHVLVMTATPIPRTLAMSLYGDLDISVIDELPPGRKPIKTVHRYDANRLKVFRFIKDEIEKGRQIYIVYPLIQESEAMDYKDLMDGYESVAREFPPPKYQISIVHGQMKPADKDYEMERFVKGETQIMVATTVIEVGVNVPNASVMIIESAERFGLSQLHQLRGRVGRGADQSFCILMTGHKLSDQSKTRLETMVTTNDGFQIADVDLKLRGPGDIMGTQQSGMLALKIADIVKDNQILKAARHHAMALLKDDPTLEKPKNAAVRRSYAQLVKYKNIWNYIS
ncbi:helicase-related protein [Maribacter sp. 2307ULW6-5]|uniref:helicase-related protein n=1 Tax=Maribacter sp. 2307ULW6-5 TaxID=3386275 RepID=UPI0039BC7710